MRMEKRVVNKKFKRENEKSVRVNITVPPALMSVVPDIIKKHGFSCFADYIQARIRKDAGLEIAA